jgi:stringent starvation protein B
MLDWIVDNGWTPHLIVDARPETVMVPREFVTEGFIRLNISASATQSFRIDADAVEFQARFSGVSHFIHVPLEHILAIVARENGKGLAFTVDQAAPEAGEGQVQPMPESAPEGNDAPPTVPPPGPERPRRPSLKVVK